MGNELRKYEAETQAKAKRSKKRFDKHQARLEKETKRSRPIEKGSSKPPQG
jgi:hypothetical protein